MLYHVSSTHGIKLLDPKMSSHGKAYVYAIENRITGLIFGAKWNDSDFRLDTDENGTPTLYECYPGAFDKIYKNQSCSVYTLPEEGFMRGITGWSPELVCEKNVEVISEEYIDDLYGVLSKYAENGKIILKKYNGSEEHRQLILEHINKRLSYFKDKEHIGESGQKFKNDLLSTLEKIQNQDL